jgi:SAM-dependent methyltransferase
MNVIQSARDRFRKLAGRVSEPVSMVGRLQTVPGALRSRLWRLGANLRWFRAARRAEREDGWDRAMGTDTSGFVMQVGLGIDRSARGHAHEYMATLPRTFEAMVESLPIDPCDFTFIDIGAGKGRTLLLAAARGFRRVIGVEISPRLCQVAIENVRNGRIDEELRERIEVHCRDALTFEFPPGPLVIYFFHAFDAEVFAVVMRRLREAMTKESRPVFFAYLRPEHDPMLRDGGVFALLAESPPRAVDSPEWPWKLYAATQGVPLRRGGSTGGDVDASPR